MTLQFVLIEGFDTTLTSDPADAKVSVIEARNHDATYEVLNSAVGGYIQMLPLRHDVLGGAEEAWVTCHEEGKIIGLPINPVATELCWVFESISHTDCISGPLVITGGADRNGNTTSAPQRWLDWARANEGRTSWPMQETVDGFMAMRQAVKR